MVKVDRIASVSNYSSGAEWRLLTEVLVAGEADQRLLVVEQVIETVKAFHLSTSRLDELKTAVTRAVMSEVKLSTQDSDIHLVLMRVMISQAVSDERSNLQECGASGWGFFLIEKMLEEALRRRVAPCHVVELFLYLEGESQESKKEKL